MSVTRDEQGRTEAEKEVAISAETGWTTDLDTILHEHRDMEPALRAMAHMIYEDNPTHLTVSEIIDTWSNATRDEVDAVKRLEANPRFAFLLKGDWP